MGKNNENKTENTAENTAPTTALDFLAKVGISFAPKVRAEKGDAIDRIVAYLRKKNVAKGDANAPRTILQLCAQDTWQDDWKRQVGIAARLIHKAFISKASAPDAKRKQVEAQRKIEGQLDALERDAVVALANLTDEQVQALQVAFAEGKC